MTDAPPVFRLSGTITAQSLDEAIALVVVLEKLGWKGQAHSVTTHEDGSVTEKRL